MGIEENFCAVCAVPYTGHINADHTFVPVGDNDNEGAAERADKAEADRDRLESALHECRAYRHVLEIIAEDEQKYLPALATAAARLEFVASLARRSINTPRDDWADLDNPEWKEEKP